MPSKQCHLGLYCLQSRCLLQRVKFLPVQPLLLQHVGEKPLGCAGRTQSKQSCWSLRKSDPSPSPDELSLPGLGPVLPEGSAEKDHLLERNMYAGQAKKQKQPLRMGNECAVQCVVCGCLFSTDGEIFTQSLCLLPPSTFHSPHPGILLLPSELGVPFLPFL